MTEWRAEIIIKKKNIYFLLQQLISQTVLFIHSSFHLIILVLYNLINHGNTKSSYQFNSKYSGIHEAAHAFSPYTMHICPPEHSYIVPLSFFQVIQEIQCKSLNLNFKITCYLSIFTANLKNTIIIITIQV